MLPMCQRCTGFYVGAAVALALLFIFRPRPGSMFRYVHLFLVIAMAPFGFHLVEHGAILRTVSGHWFGFGVAGLLWLMPARLLTDKPQRQRCLPHFQIALASILVLPVCAVWGGKAGAFLIIGLAIAGWMALVGLVAANLALIFSRIMDAPHSVHGEWNS